MLFGLIPSQETRDQKKYGDRLGLAEARAKLARLASGVQLEQIAKSNQLPVRFESNPESEYHNQQFRLDVDLIHDAVVGAFYQSCKTSKKTDDGECRPSPEKRSPINYPLRHSA